MIQSEPVRERINIKAKVNQWINLTFTKERNQLSISAPVSNTNGTWHTTLLIGIGRNRYPIGEIVIENDSVALVEDTGAECFGRICTGPPD